jgi:hypothetical protein
MKSSSVGQIEKKTQQRVVKLFRDKLGYTYLGEWFEEEGKGIYKVGSLLLHSACFAVIQTTTP